jgi:hypothetical protein
MFNQSQEDYINKRIIYCSLLLQEYGYRELLDSPLIKGGNRYKCRSKLKYIKNLILQIEKDSRASKEMIAKSEDLALDNVGLMATIVGTLALVPECQIDFIEKEFSKVCTEAMKRFNEQKLKEKENEMDN